MTRAIVTPRHGAPEEGELLYLHTYPDRNHKVGPFHDGGSGGPYRGEWCAREHREPQTCAVRREDGRVFHFTVPKRVDILP